MKDITLGRYVPHNSFVHRIDARIKLFATIAVMILIFFRFGAVPGLATDTPLETYALSLIMYASIGLFIFILLKVSHIKIRALFRQLKSLWFMIFFLLIINLFTYSVPNDKPAFILFGYQFMWGPIIQTFYIFFRLVLLLALTMVLTGTTRPLDLTYALEWYMHPLKVIRFPVHEIAMTISLALRFIPTLLDETGRIMKAQESRGVDYKKGKIKEKLRAIVSLIVPLFISAFQRSDDLTNAMEARGYNPQGVRSRYRVLKWRGADTIALICVLLVLGGFIAIRVIFPPL